ncbi:hypothetical protein HG535_0H03780 [Zygotorulaspora mrakii]|uniref:Golgi SNAP receptor complex member 1 n=1 Tax=Zygotorulaspora mrakii TaxID=42260 RepID=A0A7H9B8G6_ZYGMR|nr:uncharacterized protein HG535_0H03780 [Zygotorulaspora mrakii]QLG75051.1 hypothetical protein HG535_0H03780 [Zygotorulaspora mrakii]
MSTAQSFVTIRSQAISLETQAESLLSRYSSFAQTTSSEQTGEERKLDKQLEDALFRRQEVIEALSKVCNENPNISASKLSQLQRHKEILQEHWKSFRNIRSSIQQERNRLNLLFNVKNDIAQQQESATDNDLVGNEDDYYHNESRRVDQSHSIVDRLISQAWETRDEFSSQGSILQNANNRVSATLQRIPGINQVIKKIGTRRRKNAIILATVIVICVLILFFTW